MIDAGRTCPGVEILLPKPPRLEIVWSTQLDSPSLATKVGRNHAAQTFAGQPPLPDVGGGGSKAIVFAHAINVSGPQALPV